MRKFFGPNKKLEAIQTSLMNQQSTIESYISKLNQRQRKRVEWCTVHGRECESTGLLMWEKDLNSRYTFLNTRHCNDFFHISLADVRSLIGKTDVELVKDFIQRTGLENSFGNMCASTDQYTLDKNEPCRFWELGYIGDKIFILDVTKQPLLDDSGVVIGTRSWAINNSNKECEVKTLLELFLKTGEAVRLGEQRGKKIAAYLILKKDNPFNGVFPA